jgi:hypothetical protein
MMRFIGFPPQYGLRCIVSERRRSECFEDRARPLFKGIDSPKTLRAGHRPSLFIEYRDHPAADEKGPLASVAVIESAFAGVAGDIAGRTDNELVSQLPLYRSTIFPELHLLAKGQLLDHRKRSFNQREIRLEARAHFNQH